MARFLIEVDHEANAAACARAVQVFLATGSHYLTHADWGCSDGAHTAWIILEAETKEQARTVLPSGDRAGARIVTLTSFEEAKAQHLGHGAGSGR